MDSIGEERGVRTLSCNHTQKTKLAGVEVSSGRWAARKEINNWGWGSRVESHQSL